MADIPAIKTLQSKVDQLKNIRSSFDALSDSDIDAFREDSKKTCSEVGVTLVTVNRYADQIQTLVKEIAAEVKLLFAAIQARIRELIDSLKVNKPYKRYGTLPESGKVSRFELTYSRSTTQKNIKSGKGHNQEQLEKVLALAKVAKQFSDARLDELATETQLALEKSKSGADLSQNEINHLQGSLDSWANYEEISYKDKQDQERQKKQKEADEKERNLLEGDENRREEESKAEVEKRRQEEEDKRKEDEERKRKIEKRLQKDQQEKQRREEVERKRKEKEDEKRKKEAEEKRQRQEKRKKEEERKRKENEERKRKEEEEEKRKEEEQRKRKDEERMRREEARKRKEEEEERKRKKEEERKQKEEEERQQKEKDEERKRKEKEDDERKQREEEERRRTEKEERRQKDEEEKRRLKEVEEKRKQEEADKRRKREEEQRRFHEMEKERRRKEQERLDPNNWPWHEYPREETLEVDGDRSYHKGVCCYISSPVGNINYDDVICNASDEVDDVIEHIATGDKVASSLISIKSTKGDIKTEVPLRVHVPHVPIRDPQEELFFVVSLNESGKWKARLPVKSRQPPSSSKDLTTSALSVDTFESLNVIAVIKRKGEVIIVDPPGKIHQLVQDKNLTLVLPRETYGSSRTEMRVTVRNIVVKDIACKIEHYSKIKSDIFSAGPLITIQCEKTPLKSFELDITCGDTKRKEKLFYLLRGKDERWGLASTGSKGIHDDVVSVTFPPGNKMYSFMMIEMSATIHDEDAFRAAEAIFSLLTKTMVNVLIRQRSDDSTVGILHVVCHENLHQRLKELDELGYDFGEACSSEFALQDGDRIRTTMSGNVCFASGVVEPIIVTFSALFDRARLNVKFAVKDSFIQKEYPYFMGRLTGQVVPKLCSLDHGDGLRVEVPVNLSKNKLVKPKSAIHFVPIKFPFYMSALTTFLADRITSTPGLKWIEVVDKLDTRKNIGKLQRQAKVKCIEGNEQALCRMVLLDWMKEQPRHVNKVEPILDALIQCHHKSLYKEAKKFVDHYTESLSDDVLRDVTRRLTGSPADIGMALGFTPSEVKDITTSCSESEQIFLLLAEWRETDRAVKCGFKAADEMKKLLTSWM